MRRLTRRQRVAFTVLALIALGFVSLDVAGGRLRGVHGGVSGAFGVLYRGTDALLGPVRQYAAGLPHAGSAKATIDRLEADNARLRAQLAAGQLDKNTADALARLQLAADDHSYSIVPARVTALAPGGGFDWTLTLDVGSASGVRVDQTVTDGNALVGRVLKVTGGTCTVLLATDPDSGVGVRDTRSGQLALATGRGSGGYTLVPLDPAADLKVGDELRTGPAGVSSYAADLAVGTVTSVHSSTDGATRATVRPAVSPTGLALVGVITGVGSDGAAARSPLGPASPTVTSSPASPSSPGSVDSPTSSTSSAGPARTPLAAPR